MPKIPANLDRLSAILLSYSNNAQHNSTGIFNNAPVLYSTIYKYYSTVGNLSI